MSIHECVSSIAELKKSAFQKYCNKNGIQKLCILSNLNKHHVSGFFCFIILKRKFIFELYKSFFCVLYRTNCKALTTTKLIRKIALKKSQIYSFY